MNQIKIILLTLILLLTTFFLYADSTAPPLCFTYTFLYDTAAGGIRAVTPEEPALILSARDKIKIILRPAANTFLYLFLIDADENLHLLFPKRMSFFDLFYTPDTDYYFPEDGAWAEIDASPGTDEFILIASAQRLDKLENLAEEYTQLLNSRQTTPSQLAATRCAAIEEIQSLRHDHSPFTRAAKAAITKIACKVRSGDTEEYPGIRITGQAFYTQTTRITYRQTADS